MESNPPPTWVQLGSVGGAFCGDTHRIAKAWCLSLRLELFALDVLPVFALRVLPALHVCPLLSPSSDALSCMFADGEHSGNGGRGALSRDGLLQGAGGVCGVEIEPQATLAQYRQSLSAGGPRYLIHFTPGGCWQGARDGWLISCGLHVDAVCDPRVQVDVQLPGHVRRRAVNCGARRWVGVGDSRCAQRESGGRRLCHQILRDPVSCCHFHGLQLMTSRPIPRAINCF